MPTTSIGVWVSNTVLTVYEMAVKLSRSFKNQVIRAVETLFQKKLRNCVHDTT